MPGLGEGMTTTDSVNIQHLVQQALSFYADEPCRVCGELIKPSDLKELIFAGYSADHKSRAAHVQCWEQKKPQLEWAYPE